MQDRQLVEELLLHVAHVESHTRHALLSSANLPSGHSATHVPSSKYLVPLVGHVMQFELAGPSHEAQLEWHGEHEPWELLTSTKVPAVGQEAMQAPALRNDADVLVQVTHWSLFGPEHVPQEAWQGSQTPLVFAYFPTDAHDARQLPGRSKNGVEVEQVVHSPAPGPVHVMQLSWQTTQVSADEALPPAHA